MLQLTLILYDLPTCQMHHLFLFLFLLEKEQSQHRVYLVLSEQHDDDLQVQMQKMTTLVAQLSEEVKGLRETKAQVDKYMTADMGEMIKDYTNDYLAENLVTAVSPELFELLRPIRQELNTRIRG